MNRIILACFITGFFVCISYLVRAQFAESKSTIDSLKRQAYQSPYDSIRLESMNALARSFSNHDSIIYYSLELIDISDDAGEIWRYRAYQKIGQSYRYKGELDESIKFLFKALNLAPTESLKGVVQINLAEVYDSMNDLEKTKESYKKAIRLFLEGKTKEDSIYLTSAYNNYGDHFFMYGEYDSALSYFKSAIPIAIKLGRDYELAMIRGNIALVNAGLGKIDEAEKQITEAINYLGEIEDFSAVAIYLTYLADIYLDKGEWFRAEESVQKSLSFALKNNLKEQIRDAYLKLSRLYKLEKKFKEALEYQDQYIAYRDSINNIETVQKIADLRTEFEVGQKQAEVDVLTVQQKNQKIITWAVTAFAFILVILAAIIYKYYQSKTKTNEILEGQKKQLETLNATKDKFFSIISHDLRGPISAFQGVSRMIEFAVKTKNTDELMELAKDIDESADRLSNLLDSLLSWALQQQGHFPNVPEKVDLQLMANELQSTFKNTSNSKRVKFNVDIQPNLQLWVDRNTTQTIIRNLINNSLKFTEEGGTVTLQARSQDNKAEIRVEDTGVGMDEDKLERLFKLHEKKSTYGTSGEKGLGLGLQLVYEFVEMNNGTIQVESKENKGTTFIIELPLYDSAGLLEPVQ